MGFRKVGSGLPSLSLSQFVEETPCFGWIDGVRRRIDDQSPSIRFTPKKPKTRDSRLAKLVRTSASSQRMRQRSRFVSPTRCAAPTDRSSSL